MHTLNQMKLKDGIGAFYATQTGNGSDWMYYTACEPAVAQNKWHSSRKLLFRSTTDIHFISHSYMNVVQLQQVIGREERDDGTHRRISFLGCTCNQLSGTHCKFNITN